VTHDYSEALAVADRTALMRDGRIIEQGPTLQLFERPKTSFAASFLGLHNALPGRVLASSDAGWQVLVGETLSLTLPREALGTPAPAVGDEIMLGFDQWSADLYLGETGKAALGGTITGSAIEHGHARLSITLDGGLGTVQHRLPGLAEISKGSRCALALVGTRAWRLTER
jgi:ABC-type Fe3+/spermidine/putrescine transport system ATPase subunit